MKDWCITEGLHYLSGVDEVIIPADLEYDPYAEDKDAIALIIDDKYYITYTDPSDGYRSYGCFYETSFKDYKMLNKFPPQAVIAEYESWNYDDEEGYYHNEGDVLVLKDAVTGNVVLEVGTDHSDTYYPYSIFRWHPENLAINQNV